MPLPWGLIILLNESLTGCLWLSVFFFFSPFWGDWWECKWNKWWNMDIDVIRIHNHVCCSTELVKYRLYLYKGKKEKIMEGYYDSRFKGLIAITLFNSNNSLLLRGQLNVAQWSCTVIPNRAVVITGTNLTDKSLLMQLWRIFTIHYLFQTLTADDFICNTWQDPNFVTRPTKKTAAHMCGSVPWPVDDLCQLSRARFQQKQTRQPKSEPVTACASNVLDLQQSAVAS